MFSPDVPTNVSPSSAVKQAALAFLLIGSVCTFLGYNRPEAPAVPRTYPHDGLTVELGGHEGNKVRYSLSNLTTPYITRYPI